MLGALADPKRPHVGRVTRRPLALEDLVEVWRYIADDNETAADGVLDRIYRVLDMLSDRPEAGRARPELADSLRSFPVGNYVVFYRPIPEGIELIRVRSGYLDIGAEDFDA